MDIVLNVAGIPLNPSYHGTHCPGNGEDPEVECCCDECNYFLICFPDWEAWYGT